MQAESREEPGNEATLTGNGLVTIEHFLGCAELAVSIFQKANKTMVTCFMISILYQYTCISVLPARHSAILLACSKLVLLTWHNQVEGRVWARLYSA